MKDILPNKLSKLVLVALKDLEKVEKDPSYEVLMFRWHYPNAGKCQVCLAGSVLAKSLKVDILTNVGSSFFNKKKKLGRKLRALDDIRAGNAHLAMYSMGIKDKAIKSSRLPFYIDMPAYNLNPLEFKAALLDVATILAAEGF